MKQLKNYTNVKPYTESEYEEEDGIQTGFGKTQRTSDIYERFINRVQQIDADGEGEESNRNAIEDGFSVTSSYAPLSKEELDFFTNNNTERQPNNVADIYTENNKVETVEAIAPSYPPIHNPESIIAPDIAIKQSRDDDKNKINASDNKPLKPLSNNPLTHKKNNKIPAQPVNNIKLLTTGLICGLLLSAAIVVILNKIGVLSTLESASSSLETNSQTAAHKNQDVAASANRQAPVTAETAVMEANTQNTSKPAAPNVLPTTTAPVATQPSIEPEQRQTTRDSTISIEDFEKEAQSTLYRETKN